MKQGSTYQKCKLCGALIEGFGPCNCKNECAYCFYCDDLTMTKNWDCTTCGYSKQYPTKKSTNQQEGE